MDQGIRSSPLHFCPCGLVARLQPPDNSIGNGTFCSIAIHFGHIAMLWTRAIVIATTNNFCR
jgi:hypothetical protein